MMDKEQTQAYLQQKVNPLLEDLLTQIIKNKPKNVLNYCRSWFEKKVQTMAVVADLSDSEDQQQQSPAFQLMQRKGRDKWYNQRKGICGQVYGNHHMWQQFQVPVVNKKSTVNSRILFRLKSLFLFKDFDDNDIERVITAMTEIECPPNTYLIKQGETGSDMFVVDSGSLDCLKTAANEQILVKTFKEGQMFGQMAVLYNLPRWASIRSKTACVLFRLDRKTYHCLINDRNLRKRKIFQSALQRIEILKELQIQERYKLQDLIKQIPIHLNQYIIRQGKINKSFYVVQSGKFMSLKKQKSGNDKILEQFKEGDVFGQSCLISKQPSTQSIISLTNGKLYQIEKEGFERVLGPVTKIIKRSIEIYERFKNYDNA